MKKIFLLIKEFFKYLEGDFEFNFKKFYEELQRFTKNIPREMD